MKTIDQVIGGQFKSKPRQFSGYLIGIRAWVMGGFNEPSATNKVEDETKTYYLKPWAAVERLVWDNVWDNKTSINNKISSLLLPYSFSQAAQCFDSAHCEASPMKAPAPKCQCGFHAFYSLAALKKSDIFYFIEKENGFIAGAVLAWGKIQLHSEGFRAEFIKPLALIENDKINPAIFKQLAQNYTIPVLSQKQMENYVSEFGQYWKTSKEYPFRPRFKVRAAQAIETLISHNS